ncbi:hypothetical protein K435DRAFT_516341 [Dendrothele bispora CBS 962.96]|uniref:G-protein coupled receptors family 2 profile 2 domain-containing protein n=1 Tax=Dendrothele bispora (strain CBS 962.96) TaxID=1314807 RepID=A0A4S8KVE3_DENBC|nr:hypothetical protein K435DRAFT_516341 [Dendrothele bispora CBS 962.96]
MTSSFDESNSPDVTLIHIFNSITILGFILLLVIVLTAWRSPFIHRTSTWYCFLTYGMIFDLANFILLGRQTGENPSYKLCLIQASLNYMVPVLTAYGGVALVLQLFFSITLTMRIGYNPKAKTRAMYLLWGIPPCLAVVIFLKTLMYGVKNPGSVIRSNSGMICKITDSVPSRVSSAFVIVAILSIMIIQVIVAITVFRHWRAFRKLAGRERDSNTWKQCTSIIRCFLFFLLGGLGLGIITGISLRKQADLPPILNARSNIITETVPLAAGVIFGTQRDILQSWTFWKKSRRLLST